MGDPLGVEDPVPDEVEELPVEDEAFDEAPVDEPELEGAAGAELLAGGLAVVWPDPPVVDEALPQAVAKASMPTTPAHTMRV